MSVPNRHHYLPEFYLKAWAVNGEVTEYSRQRSGLDLQRRSPRATGFQMHLYSLPGEPDAERREQIELNTMRQIDEAAAPVLCRMRDEPGAPLCQDQTNAWTIFVMSMLFRNPARLEWFDEQIRSTSHKFSEEDRAEYQHLRSASDPASPEDFFRQASGDDLSVARMQLMLNLIGSQSIGRGLAEMAWSVLAVPHRNHGLLTCDDPVMTSNGMNRGDSFILLPVGPEHLFVAANSDRALWSFTSQRPRDIERAMNDAIVAQASKLVIGAHDRHSTFIDRRLGKSEPSSGYLGRHTWKCP
ncbi:DUF4238 domain-containing protein [Brevundimonas vesicularis]|nr:DUF4238 domain-containing protein [Brevundimonas vesicularis]